MELISFLLVNIPELLHKQLKVDQKMLVMYQISFLQLKLEAINVKKKTD